MESNFSDNWLDSADLFGDHSAVAMNDILPTIEPEQDPEQAMPAAATNTSSYDLDAVIRWILDNQIKLMQQLSDIEKKMESQDTSIQSLGKKIETQETIVLERSQMMIERINNCICMLDKPLDEHDYTESEYSGEMDSSVDELRRYEDVLGLDKFM